MRIESSNEISNQTISKLEISYEDQLGPFIKSKFNKVEESYRSPLSNEYFPLTNHGKYPPQELRFIEEEMNKLMKVYTKLYYGPKAISSVYAWELGDSLLNGFMASILVSNETGVASELLEQEEEEIIEGKVESLTQKEEPNKKKNFINSINIFNVKFSSEVLKNKELIKVSYKLQSTMMVGIASREDFSIGSTLSRNFEENHYIKDYSDNEFHIDKLGRMLEYAENSLRLSIEEIEIKKFNEIIGKLRPKADMVQRMEYYQNVVKEQKETEQQ